MLRVYRRWLWFDILLLSFGGGRNEWAEVPDAVRIRWPALGGGVSIGVNGEWHGVKEIRGRMRCWRLTMTAKEDTNSLFD